MVKIRIRDAYTFIKYSESTCELETHKPFSDIAEIIKDHLHIKSNNVKFLIIKENSQTEINDMKMSLSSLGFSSEDAIQIESKEAFLSIKMGNMCVVSYLGPLVIIACFFINHGIIASHPVQRLASVLAMVHYFKRIIECIYIHDYGRQTIPVFSIDFLGTFFYYWFLFGGLVGYFLFQKDYEAENFGIERLCIFTVLMVFAEINNLQSHLLLRNLKEENKGKRGIPKGGIFEFVTSGHYFWELMSWVFFALLTNLFTAYLFVVYSFFSMGVISYKRHKDTISYFGDQYPKGRKAFIPFIL